MTSSNIVSGIVSGVVDDKDSMGVFDDKDMEVTDDGNGCVTDDSCHKQPQVAFKHLAFKHLIEGYHGQSPSVADYHGQPVADYHGQPQKQPSVTA